MDLREWAQRIDCLMAKDVIVFEIWAPFAYFRKMETTTTSLTFSFMPRSAAEGLIGAILGLDFNESPEKLKDSRIAIRLKNPVEKSPFSSTYTDTKEIWPRLRNIIHSYERPAPKPRRSVAFRTRVKTELLRNPYYRIYFDDTDEMKESLQQKLQKHETVFTPYLGSSSMIANFEYIGQYDYQTSRRNTLVQVASIIPFFNIMPKIQLEKGVTFAVEQNMPIHLTSERISVGTYSAVYNPFGAQLKVSDVVTQEIHSKEEMEHVIFIPTEIPPKEVT